MAVQYSAPLPIAELKAAGDGTWEVSGYVSTFGALDRGGDVVMAGAFDRALSDGRRVKFLYAHDQSQVLGVPLGLNVDEHGLFGRFKISRTRLGEDVHTLLKDGALDSFSIGFFVDELDFDSETGSRMLRAIDLLEASVVAIPMNPDAVVTHVKAAIGGQLTMDEQAQAVLASCTSFVDRCRDLASLRAGDGRVPGAAFFERLQSVRAAADELLTLQAVKQRDPPADVPHAPADERGQGADLSVAVALRRARLRHAGLLGEHPP